MREDVFYAGCYLKADLPLPPVKEFAMIDPRFSARAILGPRPDFAEPLFDLLVWVSEEMKTASDRAVLDEILEDAYAKTNDAQQAREVYKTGRKEGHDAALTLTPSVRS